MSPLVLLAYHVKFNAYFVFHLDRSSTDADGRNAEFSLAKTRRAAVMPIRPLNLHFDRMSLPVQHQIAQHIPFSRACRFYRRGMETDFREFVRIEHLRPFHRVLHLRPLAVGAIGVEHLQVCSFHFELNRTLLLVEAAALKGCTDFVIMRKSREKTRLVHADSKH